MRSPQQRHLIYKLLLMINLFCFSYLAQAAPVTITFLNGSLENQPPLSAHTIYIRKINNETGRSAYWSAKKLSADGTLSLDLPDLPDTRYVMQAVSPNTGKRISTPIIDRAGEHTFSIGSHGLTVTLKNAINQQVIADTRVRLYLQTDTGYWKWQTDSYTDAMGITKFDLTKLQQAQTYKLVTTVFNGLGQSSLPITSAGEFTFNVGSTLLTLIDGPSEQPLAKQKVTIRQING